MIASVNEDSSNSECQLNSIIQESSRGTKKRKGKTSKSRKSSRIEGRKNLE